MAYITTKIKISESKVVLNHEISSGKFLNLGASMRALGNLTSGQPCAESGLVDVCWQVWRLFPEVDDDVV